MEPLFRRYVFGPGEREAMDRDGYWMLPDVLTPTARGRLSRALARVEAWNRLGTSEHPPRRFAAEIDPYLASLIGHPQLLEMVRSLLGDEIRFDHCVCLNRTGGYPGMRWHGHGYAEDDPRLGFVRIFLYVSGFGPAGGGLKIVPGSHLFRDAEVNAESDALLREGWLADRRHPATGEPLEIRRLEAPPGSVVIMWTHAVHGVDPLLQDGDTRWTVVYGFRNPGLPSRARWISPSFERTEIPGAEGLLDPA